MVYFKLAGNGISLEGLEVRTEGGYELDMSRDGYVGVNFNTPEPAAAALGLFGFSLSMLRRRRTAA
ncbi:unknown [Akkermansia sp. CAG:344]|nr:unknown [Akkermansia sp. CAG:344]